MTKGIIIVLLLLVPVLAACKDWSCFTGFPPSCAIGYHVSGANSTEWNCTADTGAGGGGGGITNSTAWNKTNGFVILADTDDYVGIGTTEPTYVFDVQGTDEVDGDWRIASFNSSLPLIELDRQGNYEWDFGLDNNTYAEYSDFIFRDASANAVRMIIKAATGFVGINTINPGDTLTVDGNTYVSEYLELPEDLDTEQDLKFVIGTDYATGTAILVPWTGIGITFNGMSYTNRSIGAGFGSVCNGTLCFGTFAYGEAPHGVFTSYATALVGGPHAAGAEVLGCQYKTGGACEDYFNALQVEGCQSIYQCEYDAFGNPCDANDARIGFGTGNCNSPSASLWYDTSDGTFYINSGWTANANLTYNLGSSEYRWNNFYGNGIHASSDIYSEGTIYADDNFAWESGNGSIVVGSLTTDPLLATTALGISAGSYNTEDYGTFIGNQAGYQNNASYATFVGYLTGFQNIGKYNVAVGSMAAFQNDGEKVTAMGHHAGAYNLGNQLSAYGMYSGYQNEGNWTTGIGYQSIRENTGDMSLGVGYNSGLRNSGQYLIGVGPYTGQDNTGQGLIAIGYEAGKDNTGANVVAIGYEAGEGNTEDDQLIIKNNFLNPTPLIQGNFTSGNVGIGTTAPTERLHVEGNLKVTGIVNATNVTVGDPWTLWTNNQEALYLTEDQVGGSNVSIEGDLFPTLNNTYDLGSSAFYWRNVYATGISGGGGGGGAGDWSDAGLLYTNGSRIVTGGNLILGLGNLTGFNANCSSGYHMFGWNNGTNYCSPDVGMTSDAGLLYTNGSRTVTGGNLALAWGNLTSTPTTLAGYGITNHLLTTDAGLLYTNGSRTVTGGDLSLAWANLTSYPNDCGANNYVYGLSDGALLCRADQTGSGDSFSDAGLLYMNGTRPLTRSWNVGPYNMTARNIAVSEGILFNNTEFPANTSNAQTRPWSPDTDRLLVYQEFWGDAALTDLTILGAETINTADTDVYGVHNFANAATNVTDGAYSITPSTATNVGFYYIYNVTNVFETRAKFLSVTSITGAVGLFTTYATQALYNGASCGSFFNYTRGTAGTAYWYTTTCSARYNCTSTVTTIPVSITRYETFKILPRVNNGFAWVEFYINNALVANHTGATHPISMACTAAWIGAWEESIEAVAKNLRVDYLYYDRVRA